MSGSRRRPCQSGDAPRGGYPGDGRPARIPSRSTRSQRAGGRTGGDSPPLPAAAARAARIWEAARPAPADHPYLLRKQVGPNGLRCDSAGNLIVPLRDVEGLLHTIETITPAGEKRYLAGGAKAGHFCTIGGAARRR